MDIIVVVTFLFAGAAAPQVTLRHCDSQDCVAETVRLAQLDPAVIRYQVLQPGDLRDKEFPHMPFFEPLIDEWKT